MDTADGAPAPLIVIGGSAGALDPLRRIVGGLTPDLPAAVCVAIHMPDDSPSALARLLARAGPLDAAFAEHGAPVAPGTIRVAPPGSHLLVHDGHLVLSDGARENAARPAIDPLFRSAARARGRGVVSVLLSGTLDDGSAGTAAVRAAGGVTIVQDPTEADFPDMPRNAMATGAARLVLRSSDIAATLGGIVARMTNGTRPPVPAGARGGGIRRSERAPSYPSDPPTDHPSDDPAADSVDRGLLGRADDLAGPASPYSCPACGGVLYEREVPPQYLCRLGHRYSPETLAKGQLQTIEDALWTALRSLEETASLAERVRDRAASRGDRAMELRFEARREGVQARADRIRALLHGEPTSDGNEIEDEAELLA